MQMVEMLNKLYVLFDDITDIYRVYKVVTAAAVYRPHSTTLTPTRPTRLHLYVRHARFPREDPCEDVDEGIGVGVVECGLITTSLSLA